MSETAVIFTSSIQSSPSRQENILVRFVLLLLVYISVGVTHIQAEGFSLDGGWELDETASSLTFQTVKNGGKLETSGFASFSGQVDDQGNARLTINLDSVDTKIDLRNVRMRFLFFETFLYPEAVVTAKVDPQSIALLESQGRVKVPLTFKLSLHGLTMELEADTLVTALANQQVLVASVLPITIPVNYFGLEEGVRKLEEAAEVTIAPMGAVSFNLVFNVASKTIQTHTEEHQPTALNQVDDRADTSVAQTGPSTALETTGDFSVKECEGRFEILSQTGAIYFRTGSAMLDLDSIPVLDTVIDIVKRCPNVKLLVAGHTDSAGNDSANFKLSEERARSVVNYLVNSQIDPEKIRYKGYGETKPIAPNDSETNRSRNRRIEFLAE